MSRKLATGESSATESAGSTLRPVYIYALTEPDGTPRYVGQTINLRKRLSEHRFSGTPAVQQWVVGLVKQGLRPGVLILETLTERSLTVENRWIVRIASRFPLLNGRCRGMKNSDARLLGRRRTAELRRASLRRRLREHLREVA